MKLGRRELGVLWAFAIGAPIVGYVVSGLIDRAEEGHRLGQIAQIQSKGLPKTLDADTRLDSVAEGPGLRFSYFYTLVKYPAVPPDAPTLHAALTQQVISHYCSAPDSKMFLEHGVTASFVYRASDGKEIARIEVPPSQCTNSSTAKQ